MFKTPLRAGVIGHPVAHSKSPLIHRHWIEKHGLNATYEAIDIPPENLEERVKALFAQGFAGFNVTIPHKQAVMALCDALDETARAIGAVNTVYHENGKVRGTNTDAFGFMAHLRQTLGPEFRVEKAAVLGAGGAARAVVFALLQEGCSDIRISNRSLERAAALAAMNPQKVRAVSWDGRGAMLDEVDVFINTTSLGMTGQPPLEITLDSLPHQAAVYDIVYAPLMTPLLTDAQIRGHKIVTGLGMLLHQARGGFEKWFGVCPEVTPDLERILLS